MGFLDKLFGRKKDEPSQADDQGQSASGGMQDPAAGTTGTPPSGESGGSMPPAGGESPSGGDTSSSGETS
jgi:hypothetical protein